MLRIGNCGKRCTQHNYVNRRTTKSDVPQMVDSNNPGLTQDICSLCTCTGGNLRAVSCECVRACVRACVYTYARTYICVQTMHKIS